MQENNQNFNHLKIHTQYSICEGAIKVDDLKNFCKDKKIKSIGLSDTNNLCGALEFSEEISKSGTQPIIGTQINFKFNDEIGIIPLIAKSRKGYEAILELSSNSYLINKKDETLPYCDLQNLLDEPEGIIVLSGSLDSLSGNLFKKNKTQDLVNFYEDINKIFKNDFYIEIQRHNDQNEKEFEKLNLNLSNKLKISIIATHEVFYLNQSMYEAHDALLCIKNKTYINDKQRYKLSNNHNFKSDKEMFNLFSDLPEALINNFYLPFKCNFKANNSKPMLPEIASNKEIGPDKMLEIQALKGLEEKFNNNFVIIKKNQNKEEVFNAYKNRLNHEITIINQMKYSSYFLIVSDYIKWSKKNDIPVGPGRGSGAGSLVAWCLYITDIDPIKFNLIFERFLNPDRISMPDFDIDFCEEKRDLVFNYLNTKYKGSVAHIITFGKLKARMVIRDVGRVLGLPYGFVDSICKMIPFDPSRPMKLQECINSEPRLQKLIQEDNRVKKLVDLSLKLEGLNRNFATHAAGVVIADKKLSSIVPLYKDRSSDLLLPSTQFDMYSAENAGLVKFDFLGLKTLTVINRTQKIIKDKKNKEFNIENINYEDQNVFKLLSEGKTIGLFQLESTGMKDALINMKPNRLEDIIALVALYRPGPMSNIPVYNDCKHERKEPDYLHPKLKEILEPTYGVIIYQEQVMQIAQTLSGFTAGEADILRRAMGKKKRTELERQKQRFINGAEEKGIAKDVAAGIFMKIEPFAEYGFNKSHAAAYALIAYQTAFLKTYYQNEFFSASMSMELSNQKKLSEFYEELKRMKINIVRPNINECFADFTSDDKNFYYALGAIKNVGYESISNVVKERIKNGKFKNLFDFINRIDPKDINKLQLEGLVKAGAFDNLNNNRKSLFDSIPNLILKSKILYENKTINQINLFEDNMDENESELLEKTKDFIFEERLSKEFEALGFFISDHPLNQFKDFFPQYRVINFNEFNINENVKEGVIASTILKIQEKKNQKGLSYAIIKFTDLGGVFELFVFSDLFEKKRDILKEGNSVFLNLIKNISADGSTSRINVKSITRINDLVNLPVKSIEINSLNLNNLNQVKELISSPGETDVTLKINNNKIVHHFKLNSKRKIDQEVISQLKNAGVALKIY
jgi:DNA polymerase-3 subunit alpha|tara:strand:+ start:11649 stop:15068 length:3420 start_codon:yes stop_codon:yes gene_type:complete